MEQALISPMTETGPGKWRRLSRLADDRGRFAMMAIDQRTSLEKMLAGNPSPQETPRLLRMVKRTVTRALASHATAVLADPEYGYPHTIDAVPPTAGLILAVEVSGYVVANQDERRSTLLEDFDVRDAAIAGADAVKLLIWHNPDVSEATRRHQEGIVQQVGEACTDVGMPFILEIVTYGLGVNGTSLDFVRQKPELVLDGMHTYGAPRFGVDIFKAQFPADLKYTEEYQDRDFAAGRSLYGIAEVNTLCGRIDDASSAPWVILSGGVDHDEFLLNVKLATGAGASGFLCGRAVWKDVVRLLPDEGAMRAEMRRGGVERFRALRRANEHAAPWFEHERYRHAAARFRRH